MYILVGVDVNLVKLALGNST